jgi:hypothetical protein
MGDLRSEISDHLVPQLRRGTPPSEAPLRAQREAASLSDRSPMVSDAVRGAAKRSFARVCSQAEPGNKEWLALCTLHFPFW